MPRWAWIMFGVGLASLSFIAIAGLEWSRARVCPKFAKGLRGPRIPIDIDKIKPAIAESAKHVLHAHKFHVCSDAGERLVEERYAKLLREIGGNSAGAIVLEAEADAEEY